MVHQRILLVFGEKVVYARGILRAISLLHGFNAGVYEILDHAEVLKLVGVNVKAKLVCLLNGAPVLIKHLPGYIVHIGPLAEVLDHLIRGCKIRSVAVAIPVYFDKLHDLPNWPPIPHLSRPLKRNLVKFVDLHVVQGHRETCVVVTVQILVINLSLYQSILIRLGS